MLVSRRDVPTTHRGMHGVSLSDHAEKVTWSGYWDERQRKLEAQGVDAELYGAVATRLQAAQTP